MNDYKIGDKAKITDKNDLLHKSILPISFANKIIIITEVEKDRVFFKEDSSTWYVLKECLLPIKTDLKRILGIRK